MQKGLGVVFFASIAEAMQATVELLELKPAAIEHVDRVLFDQTRGQLQFQAARDLLELEAKPCEAFLIVEFYDEATERLQALAKKKLGLRTRLVNTPAEMDLVWGLRKAGLTLLTGRPGPAKPVTGIEDAAIPPKHLPEYVAGLQSLLKPLAVTACFYGHAAAGLLHVRPVLDLHQAEDLRKFRQIADEVAALVRQFKGSLSGEHGVGMARTEYLREQLGAEVFRVMREIKRTFDPRNVFNPGKVVGTDEEEVEADAGFASGSKASADETSAQTTDRACSATDGSRTAQRLFQTAGKMPAARWADYRIDRHLRMGAGYELKLPFEPELAFAAKDHSFVGNLEQCNGCGGCRKETPTMCPTFVATGEEIMSTRGRANTIRAVLEQRGLTGVDPLQSAELEAALSNCLSCKACTKECPSNVNLALLKAELRYARHRRDGLPLRVRLISAVDLLGRWGCRMPALANAALRWRWLRWLMEKTLGFSAQRSLPTYAAERFDDWFARRTATPPAHRGPVILWDDTFVRYHEPHIGQAAVAVLEAAGFEVILPRGRQCCGRPAFSQGNLDEVRRLGRHNLDLLKDPATESGNGTRRKMLEGSTGQIAGILGKADVPIVFLEPSCWAMFKEDYRELKLAGADQVSPRCFLFEQFIEDLLSREPEALRFNQVPGTIAIHAHCHAKSLMNPAFMAQLARRLPARNVTLLDTGCCGMAGAFGTLAAKYELSRMVAQPLVDLLQQQPAGSEIVASGTSCRHQISDLTPAHPKHLAEVLAAALAAD